MRRTLDLTAVFLIGTAALVAGPCKTTPMNVTISPTYSYGGSSASSMIFPDSSAAYVDGVGGVGAIINTTCTDDLILNLNGATRHVGFSFQNTLSTNSSTPSWTSTPFWAQGTYLVVSNLMYHYSASSWYQFTTTSVIAFTPPGGSDKSQDKLVFCNPAANVFIACGGNPPSEPLNTSLVVVTHSPANTTTGAVETWTITPDNTDMNPAGSPATQVGSLILAAAKGKGPTHAGQFSLPFQIIVTRK